MPRRTVGVGDRSYLFSPDDPMPLSGRTWALVQARVVDEMTGEPPRSRITILARERGLVPRVASDGLVGLVGIPRHLFPALATQDYTVHLTVQAEGYLPRRGALIVTNGRRTLAPPAPVAGDSTITLSSSAGLSIGQTLLVGPAGPNQDTVVTLSFGPGANQVTVTPTLSHPHAATDPVVPSDFTPVILGDLAMHREPVVIRGRTVKANGNTTAPVPGASVKVTGIWRTAPPATLSVPADPPNLVSLRSPLSVNRTAAAGRLRPEDLQPILGDDKVLLDDIAPGGNVVRISNSQNLGGGTILWIDANDPDISEYLAIHSIDGGSSATQPARVRLDLPLAHPHRRNAVVRRTSPPTLGAQKQFAQAAIAGDTCIFLNDITGLNVVNEVQVTGGPNPAEYHSRRLFSVISDSQGFYRLPPLSRVAQVEITAEKPPTLPPIKREFRPDYTGRENDLNFTFP